MTNVIIIIFLPWLLSVTIIDTGIMHHTHTHTQCEHLSQAVTLHRHAASNQVRQSFMSYEEKQNLLCPAGPGGSVG